jgi:hypothetical protein
MRRYLSRSNTRYARGMGQNRVSSKWSNVASSAAASVPRRRATEQRAVKRRSRARRGEDPLV